MKILFLKNDPIKKNRYKKSTRFFLLHTDLCFVPDAFQHYSDEGRFVEQFSYPVVFALLGNCYHVYRRSSLIKIS